MAARIWTAAATLVILTTIESAGAGQGVDCSGATDEGTEQPQIRPENAALATVLLNGLARSVSLRTLVDTVQSSDVVVLLVMRPDLHDRIGSLEWITRSGGYRFVRASVSSRLTIVDRISAIGHELQHVAEVAAAQDVTDNSGFKDLYRRIGLKAHRATDAWETEQALAVGRQIHRELIATPSAAASAPRAIAPLEWLRLYRCEHARALPK